MAVAWGVWVRQRSFGGDVGRSASPNDVPNVGLMQLISFNLAYQAQPSALDKMVFEAHYLKGTNSVKSEAARLGISRQHYYRLLDAFLTRIYTASQQIIKTMH